MNEKDPNGFKIKPGHTGHAGHAMGPYVWLLRRHDDKLYGVWTSRHDAIGAAVLMPANKEDWLEPERVPAGSVRFDDVVFINPEGENDE